MVMADYIQISAQISEATKRRLDQYAQETGLKKSRIIEDAVQEHLDAMEHIPAEYIVPTYIVLTDESWDMVVDSIENPGEPTQALRDLMRRGPSNTD
jgi:uncharacterized protein (DUF1778 family)